MPTTLTDRRSLSERRVLCSVDDLRDEDVVALLKRARAYECDAVRRAPKPFSVGLLFLAPSLRTRAGFAAASVRLGGVPVPVDDQRMAPTMGAPEILADTLRTLSGMVDVIVVRSAAMIDRHLASAASACPYISGGDAVEHPTQALIDLLAIERRGPVADLRIGICGDLGARCVRSLVKLLDRTPPAGLKLIGPVDCELGFELGPALASRTSRTSRADFEGLEVLYMAGLPPGGPHARRGAAERAAFALTSTRARALPPHAVVLSPMPVIDEIHPEVRGDPRVEVFRQSDRGLYVRMAVLDHVLGMQG